MRCPACGSDTTPALPRCTRCNALLDEPAQPPGQPVQQPPEPPWAPQNWPPPSGPPADPSPWPPRDGEPVRPLSPEPWAEEPEIWRPPPPPKRSLVPFVLAGAGVVVLAAVALAIIFWPASGQGPPPPPNSPAQQQSTGAEPSAQSAQAEDTGPKLAQQAGRVDALLTEMAGTRSNLSAAVTAGCQSDDLQQVLSQRRDQLAKARGLQVDGLENGTRMREALVRALDASIASNQRYLDAAPGCPSEAEVANANSRASQAKNEFIDYWRPNAEKAGLPARSAGQI
jgi:flagellar basal body-associated protein FliL